MKAPFLPGYYATTEAAVNKFYYDRGLNSFLLISLADILSRPYTVVDGPEEADVGQTKKFNFAEIFRYLRRTVHNTATLASKPGVVGEWSHWMKNVLPANKIMHFDYSPADKPQVDADLRARIRKIARDVFFDLLEDKKSELASCFADMIDMAIPLSLLEQLNDRFEHYGKLQQGWVIDQVHSFSGFHYNENLKVFSILARRRGAKLVGYAHGISNPCSFHKRTDNELALLDCYITWGVEDSSWMIGQSDLTNLKLLNLGCVYLSDIAGNSVRKKSGKDLTVLYASGPLMEYMTDLEEITPEKNFEHRGNVLRYIEALWKNHPDMTVIYKPFHGTFSNDPIKDVFKNEMEQGKLRVVSKRPEKIYNDVDLVLWDTLSTGFAESVHAGVPTLVFQSVFEYESGCEEGRRLNDDLESSGILFRDHMKGLVMFDAALRPNGEKEAIKRFKSAFASSVARRDFQTSFERAIK